MSYLSSTTPDPSSSRRLIVPFSVLGVLAVALLVVPAPGSLSVVTTRWLAAMGSGIAQIDLVSEVGLALLALATVATAALAWFRHPARRVRLAAGAIGVVIAYGASELAKILFSQARPCSRWPIAGECPPAGDWSLPSNHATLAFGAAVVIAVAVGRVWMIWATLAVAAVVAVGRVAQGVHYVHDVALGAVFGLVITAAAVGCATLWQTREKRRGER